MTMSPSEYLAIGAKTLSAQPALVGFKFAITAKGQSSGGPFAQGCFSRDRRRLHTSFRGSLGMVTYEVDNVSASHEDFMIAIGKRAEARYPGFNTDPLEAFADLASDFQYCAPFFDDEGEGFRALIRDFKPKKGLAALDDV
jgi:hypothetical protein